MSNRPLLIATTFSDVTGHDSFGFRFCDDHGQTYNNCCEALITDDFELLKYVCDNQDEFSGPLLDWIQEGHGMNINNSWYDWGQIKHIFAEKESNPHHDCLGPGCPSCDEQERSDWEKGHKPSTSCENS